MEILLWVSILFNVVFAAIVLNLYNKNGSLIEKGSDFLYDDTMQEDEKDLLDMYSEDTDSKLDSIGTDQEMYEIEDLKPLLEPTYVEPTYGSSSYDSSSSGSSSYD